MKYANAVAILILVTFAVGCAEARRVKVSFLSDPPGGTLYTQAGDLRGPCPTSIWYDLDKEAIARGYLDAEGMVVRWPTGPKKQSAGLIRITVNKTVRRVVFVQPKGEPEALADAASGEQAKTPDKKQDERQNVKKLPSADIEPTDQPLAITAKKPAAKTEPLKKLLAFSSDMPTVDIGLPGMPNALRSAKSTADTKRPEKPATPVSVKPPADPELTEKPATLISDKPAAPVSANSAVDTKLTEKLVAYNSDKPIVGPERTEEPAEPVSVKPTTPDSANSTADGKLTEKLVAYDSHKPIVDPELIEEEDRPVSVKLAAPISDRPVAYVTRPVTVSPAKAGVVVKPSTGPEDGRILTLSERQLLLLDWNRSNSRGARVQVKRDVGGPGVEFGIHFPSNSPGSCSLSFVSTGTGGKGSLVGADVRGYDTFAIKLTLVSINGNSDPAEMKQKLVVGAVIGPTAEGRRTGYKPVTLSLAASEKTVTAKTPMSTDEIYEIGFHIHALKCEEWDPAGSRIALIAEPVKAGKSIALKSSK